MHKKSKVPFERLCIDSKVLSEPTWNDHRVALIIVDDCTNACFVSTCRTYDNQLPLLEQFICQGVRGLGHGVRQVATITRNIRSDEAGEFTGQEHIAMLNRAQARVEYTEPYTPKQNGRVLEN